MQLTKYTVQQFNLAGEVLGQLNLPAAFRLADLAVLKSLGATRVEDLS
ncbi:hypothetical protein [Stutzerimonas stutzeri]|nr:hypothetical protein [Stutzerimonas stutzeri]